MCNTAYTPTHIFQPESVVANQEHPNSIQHDEERSMETENDFSSHVTERRSSSHDSRIVFGPSLPLVTTPNPLEQGVCGLRNLGNTCFMNAGLQCLFNMPAICQHFFRNVELTPKYSVGVDLTTPFRDLLFEVWRNKGADFRPDNFKDCLATRFSQFQGFSQHDCQEFLALLLETLHEELSRKKLTAADGDGIVPQSGLQHSSEEVNMHIRNVNINGRGEGNIAAEVVPTYSSAATEDVDDDELRKVEHKNQDDFFNNGAYYNEVSALTYDNVGSKDEQQSPPSGALHSQSPVPTSSNESLKQHNSLIRSCKEFEEDEYESSFDMRKQDSPSNVMKKMKLDDDVSSCDSNDLLKQTLLRHQDCANSLAESNYKSSATTTEDQDETKGATGCKNDNKEVKSGDITEETESIIAKTFQGKYRSIICCDECKHASVTHEPFMYLPVPIPGAMERVFEILLIPCNANAPRQYVAVTVLRHGTVWDLKQAFLKTISNEENKSPGSFVDDGSETEIILAVGTRRTYNSNFGSVDRFLDDTNKLVHLVESAFYYAFILEPNNGHSSDAADKRTELGSEFPANVNVGEAMSRMDTNTVDGDKSEETDVERRDEEQEEEHGDSDQRKEERNVEVAKWKQCCICLDDRFINDVRVHNGCGAALCHDCFDRTFQSSGSPYGDVSTETGDDDSHIPQELIEAANDETLKVTEVKNWIIKCPVCNTSADEVEFLCNGGKETGGAVSTERSSRLMMMGILFRAQLVDGSIEPFDWPRMIYVFDNVSFPSLVQQLEKEVLPQGAVNLKYGLFRSESTGTKCSRCYKSNLNLDSLCSCTMIEGNDCKFIPGDSITIQFYGNEEFHSIESLVPFFPQIINHTSMEIWKKNRKNSSNYCISLRECVDAFTAVENLDENNHWRCPSCNCNRKATKQIELTSLPEILVIYLKRFYFDKTSSYKLENAVSSPEFLTLSCSNGSKCNKKEDGNAVNTLSRLHLSGAERSRIEGCSEEEDACKKGDDLVYRLQSCVCHIGSSTNSGHYTAYARNALSGLWYHYNDETVSLKQPHYEKSEEIYILFYQRQDCSYQLDIPQFLTTSSSCSGEEQEQQLPLKKTVSSEMVVATSTTTVATSGSTIQTENDNPHGGETNNNNNTYPNVPTIKIT